MPRKLVATSRVSTGVSSIGRSCGNECAQPVRPQDARVLWPASRHGNVYSDVSLKASWTSYSRRAGDAQAAGL